MTNLQFNPFPQLITERLVLRRLARNDLQELHALRSDDSVNFYLERPKKPSISDVEEFIEKINSGIDKNANIYWIIAMKNSPALVGTICIWNISNEQQSAEIGFELSPAYQGKGIMSEAILAVMEYGFNVMQLRALEGWVHPSNLKSIRLLEKHGFDSDPELKEGMMVFRRNAG